jgi:16S rRNA (guanine527-N7)-methyltransferase
MALAPRVEERLAVLAGRYGLGPQPRNRLAAVLEGLSGDGRAPTAVRDPEAALDAHIADSLVALELVEIRAARQLTDIGAGAGVPGLVLASALENGAFCLVESQASKCHFIAALAARAEIANARVVRSRVEEWSAGRELQDVVLCRALAPQPVVLEYASPLLREGGLLVEWRGARSEQEEELAGRAAGALGLALIEIRRVKPFAGARERHLHVFEKVGPTPAGFPRRAGLARKRPLGQ